MRFQAPILFLVASTLSGCSNAPLRTEPPSWLAGDYRGMLTAPVSSDCGFDNGLFEPFTWTISIAANSIQIVEHSPYKNTFVYTSRLQPNGAWWDLSGAWEGPPSMGSGTFVGRLFATDHAVVIVSTITWTTNHSCIFQSTLAGARSHASGPSPE